MCLDETKSVITLLFTALILLSEPGIETALPSFSAGLPSTSYNDYKYVPKKLLAMLHPVLGFSILINNRSMIFILTSYNGACGKHVTYTRAVLFFQPSIACFVTLQI